LLDIPKQKGVRKKTGTQSSLGPCPLPPDHPTLLPLLELFIDGSEIAPSVLDGHSQTVLSGLSCFGVGQREEQSTRARLISLRLVAPVLGKEFDILHPTLYAVSPSPWAV
jgi:hypothetical protein